MSQKFNFDDINSSDSEIEFSEEKDTKKKPTNELNSDMIPYIIFEDENGNIIDERETKDNIPEEYFIINHSLDNFRNYMISRSGKIWNIKKHKQVVLKMNKGYAWHIKDYVHRLVALTFIPRKSFDHVVNHINENKLDNRVENLEWISQKENVNKATADSSHPKMIQQIELLTGQIIAKYESIKSAAESIGVTPSAISRVLRGLNKTCCNYEWKYENEKEDKPKNIIPDLTDTVQLYQEYYLFNDGRVYSAKSKKFMKPTGKDSYPYVVFCFKNEVGVRLKKNCYIMELLKTYFPQSEHIKRFSTVLSGKPAHKKKV